MPTRNLNTNLKVTGSIELEGILYDGNSSAGTNGQVLSSTSTGTDWVTLSEISGVDGTGTANYLSKWLDANTITNSLVYDNGTNVGIGTTNPQTKLHVNGSIGAYTSDYAAGSTGSRLLMKTFATTGNTYSFIQAQDVGGNSNNVLALQPYGDNVGIGTTSPTDKLHVYGNARIGSTSQTTTSLFLTATNTAGSPAIAVRTVMQGYEGRAIGTFYTDTTYSGEEWFCGTNYSGGFNRWSVGYDLSGGQAEYLANAKFTVFHNGNVGIGIDAPAKQLHVRGSAPFIRIEENSASNKRLDLWVDPSTAIGYIGANQSAQQLSFQTANNDRIRILNNGNVGIGTVSPQASLHVAGYIGTTPTGNGVLMGLYTSGSSNYGNIQLNGDTGSFIDFSSSGTDWKGRILYDNSSNHMRFDTGGTERVRINSSGNVGIGTTSPAAKLDVKGGMSAFETTLTNNNDWENSAISILERDNVGSAQSADKYSPNLNFHWSARVSNSLWMNSSGHLNWGSFGSNGIPNADGVFQTNTINLIGTGRITGVDTVTASTDAANKAYVDAQVGSADTLQEVTDNGNTTTNSITMTNSLTIDGQGSSTDVLKLKGSARIQIENASATDSFYISNTGGSGASKLDLGGAVSIIEYGNVGIGTTNPQNKLHVVGTRIRLDTNAGGFYQFTAGGGFRFALYDDSSKTHLFADGDGSNPHMTFNAGFVGIGTENPAQELHVKGTALRLEEAGSSTRHLDIVPAVSGSNHRFTSTTTGSGFNFEYWNGSAATLMAEISSSALTVSSGNIVLSGTGRIQGIDTVTNSTDAANKAYVDAQVGSADTLQEVTDNGATTTNNISIGTTSTFTAGGTAKLSVSGLISWGASSSDLSYFRRLSAGNFQWQTYNGGNTGNIHLQPYGGNVGIGTTSPSTKLDVAGIIRVAENSQTAFYGGDFVRLFGNQSYTFKNSGGATRAILSVSTGDLSLYNSSTVLTNQIATNGNSYFNGGNVGIGTTSPSTKLHIDDDAASGTGLLVTGGGGGGPLATFTRDVGSTGTIAISSSGGDPQIRFSSAANSFAVGTNGSTFEIADNSSLGTNARLSITSAGNVGIGTTGPASGLHLQGASNTSSGFTIENTSGGTSKKFGFQPQYNDDRLDIWYNSNATAAITIKDGGNVGIGTTSPNAKLHVVGDVNFNSVFTFNTSTDLFEITNNQNTGGINLSGGNSRIYFGGSRAIEGDQSGGTLYIGEGYGAISLMDDVTVSGNINVSTSADAMINLDQTGSDTGWSYINFKTLGTRNYYVGQDSSKNFNIYNDNIDVVALSVSYASNLTTIGGDLTVAGGDITLSGTGRIQGIDTVSASSDAVNKNYVDTTRAEKTTFTRSGINNSSYTMLCTVDGNGLASIVNMTITGTSNAVVLSSSFEINVNHYQDIHVRSLSGDYTEATIRITSNNNEDYSIELKHNGSTTTTVEVCVFPQAGETITPTTTDPNYTGTEYVHLATEGIRFGGTDGATESSNLVVDGKVGIGTTSPSTRLHISTPSSNSQLTLERTGSATGKYQIYTNTNNLYINNVASNTFPLTILNSGNVGIGTVSPSSLLHLEAAASPALQIKDTTNNVTFKAYAQDSNSHLANTSNHDLFIDTNNTPRITVKAGGNVGIGTTSPTTELHVAGDIRVGGSTSLLDLDAGAKIVGQYYGNGGAELTFLKMYNPSDASINMGTKHSQGYISFAAGSGAYTERMRIKNNGNVGIGTTSPDKKLQISESNTSTSDTSGLKITNASVTSNTNAGILFENYDNNGAWIRSIRTGSSNGKLSFGTNSGAGIAESNISERMVIDHNGNVGIGTTSPTTSMKLDVVGGDFRVSDVAGDDGIEIGWSAGGGYGFVQAYDRNASSFRDLVVNNSLTIEDGGNVGIGTTNPSYPFSLENPTTGLISRIYNTNSNGQGLLIRAGATSSATRAFQVASSNDTKIMTVNSNGNVGIGTTNPSQKLHVNGNVDIDNGGILLQQAYSLNFGVSGYDILMPSTTRVGIKTAGTERVTILNTGNVGIGTTNPTEKLHVEGNIELTSGFEIGSNSGSYWQRIRTEDSSVSTTNAFNFETRNGSGSFIKHMVIRNDGNVGIGVTNPSYALQVGGSIVGTSKSFLIKHPTKEGKKLLHACIEGPENGVYYRGKSTSSILEMPDYWIGLVHIDSMTVDITAIGPNQDIYVDSISDDGDVTIGSNTDVPLNYFYVIYGERKDIGKLEIEIVDPEYAN